MPKQQPAFCPLVGTQTVLRFSYHKLLGYQSGFKVEMFGDVATNIHSARWAVPSGRLTPKRDLGQQGAHGPQDVHLSPLP